MSLERSTSSSASRSHPRTPARLDRPAPSPGRFDRPFSGLAIALLWGLALPAAAAAQEIRGVVLDHENGTPVEGGIVTLLAEDGAEVRAVLSDGNGAFRIRAPAAGRYVVQLQRIGFHDWTSEPVELEPGAVASMRIEAPVAPIALADIRVQGERRCEIDPEAGLAAAILWSEARKALKATAMGQRETEVTHTVERFERTLDPGLDVVEETSSTKRGTGKPFESLPAEELAAVGFVRFLAGPGTGIYYAPDAEVLLSDVFQETHCFQVAGAPEEVAAADEGEGTAADVAADDRAGNGSAGAEDGIAGDGSATGGGGVGEGGLVGLAFEPVSSDKPDIEGVLWLDRETARLSHLEYRYVHLGLGARARSRHVGGRVDFRRLPGGEWIVSEWYIRMPRFREREVHRGPGVMEKVLEIAGYRVEGGKVRGDGPGGAASAPAGPVISGLVYDSTRAGPLVGATISVAGADVTARTNGEGRFRLVGLDPGPWRVQVEHPKLELMGMEAERDVTLRPGQSVLLSFFLPSVASIMRQRCPEDEPRSAAVFGTVRDSGGGGPIQGAHVLIGWGEVRPARGEPVPPGTVEVYSDAEGWYRACGLPAGARLLVRAQWKGDAGKRASLPPIPPNGLRKLDFEF